MKARQSISDYDNKVVQSSTLCYKEREAMRQIQLDINRTIPDKRLFDEQNEGVSILPLVLFIFKSTRG